MSFRGFEEEIKPGVPYIVEPQIDPEFIPQPPTEEVQAREDESLVVQYQECLDGGWFLDKKGNLYQTERLDLAQYYAEKAIEQLGEDDPVFRGYTSVLGDKVFNILYAETLIDTLEEYTSGVVSFHKDLSACDDVKESPFDGGVDFQGKEPPTHSAVKKKEDAELAKVKARLKRARKKKKS